MKSSTSTLLIVAGLFLAATASAQPDSIWSKSYQLGQSTRILTVSQTSPEGFIATGGYSIDDMTYATFIMKLDENGDSLWTKTMVGVHGFRNCIQTSDGGYVVIGRVVIDGETSRNFIVKVDADGVEQWTHLCRLDRGWENGLNIFELEGGDLLAFTSKSNIVNHNQGTYQSDLNVRRLNSAGEEIAEAISLGSAEDEVYCEVIATSDGGYLAAGWVWIGTDVQTVLLKITPELETEWLRMIDYPYLLDIGGVVENPYGGYAITGYFGNEADSPSLLIQVDADGEFIEDYEFGSMFGSRTAGLILEEDGSYVVAGSSYPDDRYFADTWLACIDPEGSIIWERYSTPEGDDICEAGCATDDGGYLLAGGSGSGGFILKMGEGQRVSERNLSAPPGKLEIEETYPAPFNSTLSVGFKALQSSPVKVSLYDDAGRQVKALVGGVTMSGQGRLVLDCNGLAAGSYWLKMEQNGATVRRRVVLVK